MKDSFFSDERTARLSVLPLPLPSGRGKLRALAARLPARSDEDVPSDVPPLGQICPAFQVRADQDRLREDRVEAFPSAEALLSCVPKSKDRLVVIGEEKAEEGEPE